MTDVGEIKRNRLSIFSKEKPRAIYRNSDELPEEPPAKLVLDATPPQVNPSNSIQTLEEKLQQIEQSWQAPVSIQQLTAEYEPVLAGSMSNSQQKETDNATPAVEAQGSTQQKRPEGEKQVSPNDENRQQSFGKTTQNMPTLETDRTVEPFRRHSLEENTAIMQKETYFESAQLPQVQAQTAAIIEPEPQFESVFSTFPEPSSALLAQVAVPAAVPSEAQNNAFFNTNYEAFGEENQLVENPVQQVEPHPVAQPVVAKQQQMKKSQVFLVNGVKYIGLRELGKGGSASVYEAMTSDLQQCALKIVELKDENDELCGKNAIMREIEILEKLKGLSITLDILQYEFTEKEAFIVLELGDIDLKTFLKENPILSNIKILSLFEDMVEKTMIMHEAGFIHGDIKPHNFMFYHSKLMIIDFGISKQMQNQTTVFRDSLSGTPKYMAPEVIASQYKEPGARIHRASDVWSLGCILYEMACNESPFDAILKDAKTPLIFIDILRRKQFKINFAKIKNEFIRGLAERMLEADDEKRVSLDQVLFQLRQE